VGLHGPSRQRDGRPHSDRSRKPDIVYIAAGGDLFKANSERGLYKTSDGGRTWTKSKFVDDDTGFIDLVMDPSNSQTLIAASYQRRRTAWGFNGGGPGSALWKTIDAAKTWKRVDGGGLPAYGRWGRVGSRILTQQPNVVYAMIEPGPQAGGGGGEAECATQRAISIRTAPASGAPTTKARRGN
jgi:hypothetical protein